MKYPVLFVFLIFAHFSLAIDSIYLSMEQFLLPLEQDPVNQEQLKPENHTQALFKELKLDQLALKVELGASPVTLSVDLEQLNLPHPYANINSLAITCQSLELEQAEFSCTKGTVAIKGLFNDESVTKADFSIYYNANEDRLLLSLDNMNIGKGILSTTIRLEKNQWLVNIQAAKLNYINFKKYLNFHFHEQLSTIENPGAVLSFTGQLAGKLGLETQQKSIQQIELSGHVKSAQYTQGDNLAEQLNFKFHLSLNKDKSSKDRYLIDLALSQLKGEVFQNDIYLSFTGQERLHSRLTYDNFKQVIKFDEFLLKIPDILEFNASGRINLANNTELVNLKSQYKMQDFLRFNDLYLNSILEGTDYEGLEIEGGMKGHITKNQNIMNFTNEFKALSLSYNEQISILDLNGKVNWNNKKQTLSSMPESELSWQEMTLNNLPLGATQLFFKTNKDRLKLLQETQIPVFDGALHINTLELTQIGSTTDILDQKTGMSIIIDGMIKPISLSLVSSHFDWPLLDGTLSAIIPSTTYSEHSLEVGGAMMMQVFDGVVIVKDLKIQQPLSDHARLYANIDLNNLNLESLTKTYNFGEIQGRVEGKFSQLVLDAWQPVEFDAYLRTPSKDKSKHRISQRAIDNLSSLGGASGLLSRSFLSFFETFGYDKLGLSCKLKNNICAMSGIEKKGSNGYYIVKGGGLPRIDVMGFQSQVNWQVLTSRLQAIQSANEAVIE